MDLGGPHTYHLIQLDHPLTPPGGPDQASRSAEVVLSSLAGGMSCQLGDRGGYRRVTPKLADSPRLVSPHGVIPPLCSIHRTAPMEGRCPRWCVLPADGAWYGCHDSSQDRQNTPPRSSLLSSRSCPPGKERVTLGFPWMVCQTCQWSPV